jgi:hypothetical protein
MMKTIAIPIVIALSFLLLVEGLARMYDFRYEKHFTLPSHIMPDRLLHHRWFPNNLFFDDHRKPGYIFHSNAQSWVEEEDVERTVTKNTFRIFYLGDSNTQGVVGHRDKMAELVEQKLNLRYQNSEADIEVINTGTSSYSIMQYYLISTKILPSYSPNLVVINVDMSDVANDCVYRQQSLMNEEFLPEAIRNSFFGTGTSNIIMTPYGAMTKPVRFRVAMFLRKHSHAYDHFQKFVRRTKESWFPGWRKDDMSMFVSDLYTVVQQDLPCNWLTTAPWSEELKKNVEYSMFVLARTITFLKERNILVIVTGVPHFPQYFGISPHDAFWDMETTNQPIGAWSTKPHDELKRTTEKAGGLFLNSFDALKPYMTNAKQTDYYWSNDPTHFNISGNRIWADAQIRFILESGVLPSVENNSTKAEESQQ